MNKSELDDIHLSILNLSKDLEEMKIRQSPHGISPHSPLGISPLAISISTPRLGLDTPSRLDTPRSTACIMKTRNSLRRVSSTFEDSSEDRSYHNTPEGMSDMVTPLTPIHQKVRPLETSRNLFPSLKASIEGIGEESSSQISLPQLSR